MYTNAKPSEEMALLATIDPVSQAAGTVTTGWVDQSVYLTMMAVIDVGVFGSSATVDAKLRQAQDNAGTNAKDITGKAITTLLAAGGNNRQAIVNMKEADLDTENAFRYVQLSITVGTAATLIAAHLWGCTPRLGPVVNQAGVAQVI